MEILRAGPLLVPPLHPPGEDDANSAQDFDEHVADIFEWLSLLSLESPRILSADTIDPYLSRYEVPGSDAGQSDNDCPSPMARVYPGALGHRPLAELAVSLSDPFGCAG